MQPPTIPPTLLLIDLQRGFADPVWGARNNPHLEANVRSALAYWRARLWPVVHVRHDSRSPASPLRPGQRGNDFMDAATPEPGEPVVAKVVNSAFIGTALQELLGDARQLVIAGLATDHCVSTTARMAANLGFGVTVLADATAAFPRTDAQGETVDAALVHRVGLASLKGEFATILTTREALV